MKLRYRVYEGDYVVQKRDFDDKGVGFWRFHDVFGSEEEMRQKYPDIKNRGQEKGE
jgi:hypothetical protein